LLGFLRLALAALLAEDPDETIVVEDDAPSAAPGRAVTTVTRTELDERMPRSAPDALRWEPGVYVQQTSAAQGSPFLRGRTGQQTVLLFDGVRLNNATWRQGPNQYFFTIDARTLAAIDVIRGSASTRWGSDAIGGVLDAIPRDPDTSGARRVTPRLELRWGSADHDLGGRAELALSPWRNAGLLVGGGYRDVSLLESGGIVTGVDGMPSLVPAHAADGRTQLGTGFREATWDARLVQRWDDVRLTTAYYDYRQLDAPRTDQCPPAFAPLDECLRIDEQFHTLAYAAVDFERTRVVVSAQEQHERRTRERPRANASDGGRDDTRSLGIAGSTTTAARALGPLSLRGEAGADLYADFIDSIAWLELTDIDYVRYDSRGQYVAGSRYATGGGFAIAEARWRALTARAGGRIGLADADAPADEESATTAIDRTWLTTAGFVGLTWRRGGVELLATLDRSFRAPNLDDLTGRQAAGPGFQFENATLAPERALTGEAGVRVSTSHTSGEAWAYVSRVHGAIARSLRSIDDCPPTSRDCQGAWFRYQLVNLDGAADVRGVELAGDLDLDPVNLRATFAMARGEGPDHQPLSRVPPVNGTVEARWRTPRAYGAIGLRWAGEQTRLAASDRGDPRIPAGGTRGYAVVDLRGGLQITQDVRIAAVIENLSDAAYRYHGSSIDGAGRSLVLFLELKPR
jgi:iron complex outermembrane receptor protein/hemoglobin/transferrin/lactoferrin receptor protein